MMISKVEIICNFSSTTKMINLLIYKMIATIFLKKKVKQKLILIHKLVANTNNWLDNSWQKIYK